MKKISIILFVSALLCSGFFELKKKQVVVDPFYPDLKGKLKKLKEYIITNGDTSSISVFRYSKKGMFYSDSSYFPGDEVLLACYGNNDTSAYEVDCSTGNILPGGCVYYYNKNHQIVKQTCGTEAGYEFIYDNKGNLISSSAFYEMEETYSANYEYDEEGRIVMKSEIQLEVSIAAHKEWYYNYGKNGLLISAAAVKGGTPREKYSLHDKNGNWTRKESPEETVIREIEYY